jgi:DUF4097 and DUF4098 domain-containing protein YvlB
MTLHLLFVLLILPLFQQGETGGTVDKEIPVSRKEKLEVDLRTGGSLTVTGWDKDVVKVHGDIGGRDADDCNVDVSRQSGVVRLASEFKGRKRNRSADLSFTVFVPSEFNLSISTMGGAVTIDNIDGRIEGRTMGGPLELSRLKGNIDLTTMGGPISLKESDIDGSVKTMGGEIRLEDLTGELNARTMGGRIIQRNVLGRSGKNTRIHVETNGGDIELENAPDGADVKTMGGSIRIESAQNSVRAETMGGDISIDAVDGSVNAKTMGGDVSVVMVGDPNRGDRGVSLESMGGEVTLTVPAALSMDVELTLVYTRNRDSEYTITSDFDLKREKSADWEYGNGEPRKYERASGIIAGGKNKIRIRTVNGSVRLKKG